MAAKNTILDTLELANGIKLTITNTSQTISKEAMRVEVVFQARAKADFSLLPKDNIAPEIIKQIGEEVGLSYQKTRAFVMKEEAIPVLAALIADFKSNTLPYLAVPDFPQKLTKKRYQELFKQKNNPF